MDAAADTSSDRNDEVDQEMLDLFAIMNSTVVELQIEIDRLESNEYKHSFKGYDSGSNSDDRDDNEKEKRNQKPHVQGKERVKQRQRCCLQTHVMKGSVSSSKVYVSGKERCAAQKEGEEKEGIAIMTMTLDDDDDGGTNGIHWDRIKPVVAGDPDYVPVAAPTAHFDRIEPAKAGDPDYVPVTDYTPTAPFLRRLSTKFRSWLQ